MAQSDVFASTLVFLFPAYTVVVNKPRFTTILLLGITIVLLDLPFLVVERFSFRRSFHEKKRQHCVWWHAVDGNGLESTRRKDNIRTHLNY